MWVYCSLRRQRTISLVVRRVQRVGCHLTSSVLINDFKREISTLRPPRWNQESPPTNLSSHILIPNPRPPRWSQENPLTNLSSHTFSLTWIRNLDITEDPHLSFSNHISNLYRSWFMHIRDLHRVTHAGLQNCLLHCLLQRLPKARLLQFPLSQFLVHPTIKRLPRRFTEYCQRKRCNNRSNAS